MNKDNLGNSLQLNEIKDFVNENADLIYNYINYEILQDIGEINSDYFVKIIKEVFAKKLTILVDGYNKNPNILPYLLFLFLESKGKIDYTSLRNETLSFSKINKEASVYYNYSKFSLDNEYLIIQLMQTKIGGMPIDKDIVKFTKKILIQNKGLEEFINKNHEIKSMRSTQIRESIKNNI